MIECHRHDERSVAIQKILNNAEDLHSIMRLIKQSSTYKSKILTPGLPHGARLISFYSIVQLSLLLTVSIIDQLLAGSQLHGTASSTLFWIPHRL